MPRKTPPIPPSESPSPYEVFLCGKGWSFHRSDDRPAHIYPTKDAASAAAKSAKDTIEVLRGSRHLSCVAHREAHLRLAVIRIGLNVLGRARLDTLKPTVAQLMQIARGTLGETLAEDPTWTPPAAYREYDRLFNDMLTLDWDRAIDGLNANCEAFIASCGELLCNDGPNSIANGHEYWQWIASIIAIPESGVGRELEDLMQESPPTKMLSNLRDVCNRCAFRSHVHLISCIVHEHYLHDLSSRRGVQTGILACFLHRSDELRESVAEEINDCRRVASEVLRCARAGPALKGGITGISVAHNFLGFVAMGGWEAFAALATDMRGSNLKSIGGPTRSSGPKTINYANDRWLSRSVWDAIPVGAGILRAQGQTRSPKGRRA